MIDFNDENQIDRLRNACKGDGKLIIEYLQEELNKVRFEDIDPGQPNDIVGENCKVVGRVRDILENIINFISPEKGD